MEAVSCQGRPVPLVCGTSAIPMGPTCHSIYQCSPNSGSSKHLIIVIVTLTRISDIQLFRHTNENVSSTYSRFDRSTERRGRILRIVSIYRNRQHYSQSIQDSVKVRQKIYAKYANTQLDPFTELVLIILRKCLVCTMERTGQSLSF